MVMNLTWLIHFYSHSTEVVAQHNLILPQVRTTKEDLEEASGGGDREDWFEGGGCPETR